MSNVTSLCEYIVYIISDTIVKMSTAGNLHLYLLFAVDSYNSPWVINGVREIKAIKKCISNMSARPRKILYKRVNCLWANIVPQFLKKNIGYRQGQRWEVRCTNRSLCLSSAIRWRTTGGRGPPLSLSAEQSLSEGWLQRTRLITSGSPRDDARRTCSLSFLGHHERT